MDGGIAELGDWAAPHCGPFPPYFPHPILPPWNRWCERETNLPNAVKPLVPLAVSVQGPAGVVPTTVVDILAHFNAAWCCLLTIAAVRSDVRLPHSMPLF